MVAAIFGCDIDGGLGKRGLTSLTLYLLLLTTAALVLSRLVQQDYSECERVRLELASLFVQLVDRLEYLPIIGAETALKITFFAYMLTTYLTC